METQGRGSVTYNVRAALRMTRHETQGRHSVTYNVRVTLRMTRHGNSRNTLCNIQYVSSI